MMLFALWCSFFVVGAQTLETQDSIGGCEKSDTKLVTLKLGTIRGTTFESDSGRSCCSFRGIPFAQPPVGQYRFKPPRPPKPWEGILDATEEMVHCIQMTVIPSSISGHEDCLYLSVYTPRLKPQDGKLLDVMVWFNPGNFYYGEASTASTGPHYLMDKDVMVIYFNYRVAAFGFLSTGDDEAPGNYGMKDQVAALQFVQDNIEDFGGNSSSVTIFGLSSGAASVHYQMLSPLSKGLFHRAISLEGTAINPWARSPDPLGQAQKQAYVVGCPIEPSSRLVACLREMDATELVKSIGHLFNHYTSPSSGYAPVPEKKTEQNPDPFITDDPLVLLREGKFQRVPWYMGGTSGDVSLLVLAIINIKKIRAEVNAKLDILLPDFLLMNSSIPHDQVVNLTQKVATFYLGQIYQFSDNYNEYNDFLSDRLFVHGLHKAAQLHALAGHAEVYMYNFAYRGLYTTTDFISLENHGPTHADELAYVFKSGMLPYPPNHPDLEVRELLVSLVTNFAKYGNPTPGNNTGNYLVDQLEWLPIVDQGPYFEHLRYLNIGQVVTSPEKIKYLDFGFGPVKLNMAEDLYKERMDFWDSLPLYENCLPYCDW